MVDDHSLEPIYVPAGIEMELNSAEFLVVRVEPFRIIHGLVER